MNYKLITIAVATVVIAPVLALIASRVTENMLPAQQTANVAASSPAAPTMAAAPMAPQMSAPAPGAGMIPQAGVPDPSAGQPMVDLNPPPQPPPPSAQPSGVLPPYPGQDRAPASGTIHLPDGDTVG